MGQPAPAPQPEPMEPAATPVEGDALFSFDTGNIADGTAAAKVSVLDSDSIAQADVGIFGGADTGGTSECSDADGYGADSSAAIALHADVPSDFGALSLGSLGIEPLDSLDPGSLPVGDLPAGDCLLGDVPDLCTVLGDIA